MTPAEPLPPEPSPRRTSALVAAGGLALVLLGYLLVRFQVFAGNELIPTAPLLGWIAVGVGLFGLMAGAHAERPVFRVLRIVFVVAVALPGAAVTYGLAMKR